ncbi:hypothetical protein J1605_020744 [Eschrichtius robustus]|uniref:Uncharacterized protein n=1 Tax=Eschrichtius robustus TaxID=9764 RepID=A0AB34HJL3_ESCRO|nr:hypothetical protein J1605_020744 [Eschrichtius robustus]
MAGAIIENMSTKKLCIVGGILLLFQIIAFLVGGLIELREPVSLEPRVLPWRLGGRPAPPPQPPAGDSSPPGRPPLACIARTSRAKHASG